MLTWLTNCVICEVDRETFAITDTKLYILLATLSTQDNSKLFEQLRQAQNKYLDYQIDPNFQEPTDFVLSFEDNAVQEQDIFFSRGRKMKYYNVIINGKNLFD